MGIKPIISSSIFFIIGGFYHMVGIYVLKLSKKRANRLFFGMTALLSLWASLLSFAIIAKDMTTSRMWFSLTVVSWGFFCSLLYHFSDQLAYPNKKNGPIFYFFVYVPSFVNLFIYYLIKKTAYSQFYMYNTEWGWTYSMPIGFVSTYYTIFLVIFIVSALVNLSYWVKNDKVFHQTSLIGRRKKLTIAFFASILLLYCGTKFVNFPTIQGIALWMIIPIIAFFYIIFKYRFLDSEKEANSNQLLDDVSLEKIFDLVGYIYILLTQVIFGIHFLSVSYSQLHVLLHSSLIYIVGIAHFFIGRIFKQTKHKYYFVSFSASLLVLADVMFHIEGNGITIWAMCFFAAMITAVFDRPIYGRIVILSMLIAQTLYFVHNYDLTVFSWRDYSTRVIVLLLTGSVIQMINKLYYSRRYASNQQYSVQETLAEVSQNLIDINGQNKDEKIQMVLAKCNWRFDSQSAYIFKLNAEKNKLSIAYYQKGSAKIQDYDEVAVENFSYDLGDNHWGVDQILARNPIIVNDIERLPGSAIVVQRFYRERSAKGFHAFPITLDEDVKAVLFFEFNKIKSDESDHRYKQVIANLIGDALKKVNYEERLFKAAHIDMVTGLFNRTYLTEQLDQLISKSDKGDQHAILFIDIDNFKHINDAFGHSIGDEILCRIAEIMQSLSDERHILSRFGGDEFVITFANYVEHSNIVAYINHLLAAMDSPIKIGRYEFRLSLSIGLSLYPQDGVDVENLIKNADLAMYASKTLGKNRCYYCNDYVKNQTAENINYTNKLISALSNGELKQVYQPQMDIQSGSLSGVEVLLRWHSPEFGDVPPAKFIPLLEHMGLIGEVSEWIIDNTIKQHLDMVARGLPKVRMSVNLSGVQLQNALFIEKLKHTLQKKAIDPQYLELEILEKYIIDHSNYVTSNFNKLKEIGCLIAVDDFGVEFSSLNRLQELPIDRIKIDQHFIEGIGIDPKKETVIKIIIELAEALGFTSIAEGVETAEQFAFLKANGCQEIQGFYYSKPMSRAALEQFVIENVITVPKAVSS